MLRAWLSADHEHVDVICVFSYLLKLLPRECRPWLSRNMSESVSKYLIMSTRLRSLCVCVGIRMYTYIHVWLCVCMCVCDWHYMCTGLILYVYRFAIKCVYVYAHTCKYVYVCIYVWLPDGHLAHRCVPLWTRKTTPRAFKTLNVKFQMI